MHYALVHHFESQQTASLFDYLVGAGNQPYPFPQPSQILLQASKAYVSESRYSDDDQRLDNFQL